MNDMQTVRNRLINDISEIDTDAKHHLTAAWQSSVTVIELIMDFHGSLDLKNTEKFGLDVGTRFVEHPASVLLDNLGKQFSVFIQGTYRI